jgi:hypothetical protein
LTSTRETLRPTFAAARTHASAADSFGAAGAARSPTDDDET